MHTGSPRDAFVKGVCVHHTGFGRNIESQSAYLIVQLFDVVKLIAAINFIDVFIAFGKKEAMVKYCTRSCSTCSLTYGWLIR